ncbi:MAG: DegT/DnrJ/EryC1/StrS family aminotransferase [candidate division WOR-3 bacterium]
MNLEHRTLNLEPRTSNLEHRTLNLEQITCPFIPSGYKSVWAQYSLLASNEPHRTGLMARLNKEGIPTAIYYPKPLHLQTAFAYLGYKKGDFPVSEDCASRIFSIPMHPYLNEEIQERIVQVMINH